MSGGTAYDIATYVIGNSANHRANEYGVAMRLRQDKRAKRSQSANPPETKQSDSEIRRRMLRLNIEQKPAETGDHQQGEDNGIRLISAVVSPERQTHDRRQTKEGRGSITQILC